MESTIEFHRFCVIHLNITYFYIVVAYRSASTSPCKSSSSLDIGLHCVLVEHTVVLVGSCMTNNSFVGNYFLDSSESLYYPVLYRNPKLIRTSSLDTNSLECHDPWIYKSHRMVYAWSFSTSPSLQRFVGYDPISYILHATHSLLWWEMCLDPLFPCIRHSFLW